MAVWDEDTDTADLETGTPDGGIRFGSFFSESLNGPGLFLSLVSKTPSRLTPPGSHPRPRWFPGPLRQLRLPEPARSSPGAQPRLPLGSGTALSQGPSALGDFPEDTGSREQCPPPQGLAVGVTRGQGRGTLRECCLAPPTEELVRRKMSRLQHQSVVLSAPCNGQVD